MRLLRCGLALAVALGAAGCATGAPERASDIQNLHAIGDDIGAVTMTQRDHSRIHDPNQSSTLPNTYETSHTP